MKHFISLIIMFITTMLSSYIDAVGKMQEMYRIEHNARIQEFEDLHKDIDGLQQRLESLDLEPNEEIIRIIENN